ncbi:hypothetical protein BIW11_08702 [Tropilaelaps mercedesae]|uniref:Uncharacterized protein n=1 Tax=Tropilaelaps mercedesae TaxID=418985 RepID=A0A1V9XNF3_9ACAR|nr:hypothetical protein BIW11_08702 [Tropilaelaps mercedesae]
MLLNDGMYIMASSWALWTRAFLLVAIQVVPKVLSTDMTTEVQMSDVTTPAPVMIPSISMGSDAAKRWVDRLLLAARNASDLDPMPVKPFKIIVPSNGWTNADFHADFSNGSTRGLSRLTRSDDCTANDGGDFLECQLGLKNIHIKLKAEVKGDLFIPTVHPLAATCSVTESSIVLHLKQLTNNNNTGMESLFKLQNASISGELKVETTFIGTLSLSRQRLKTFRTKLGEALIDLLKNVLLDNYVRILKSVAEFSGAV